MEIYQQALETLKATGHRLTRQRQAVLEILLHSQEHLDAEKLYDLVRAKDNNISLATVYRSLALLKQTGLVMEHRLGEGHGHFETTSEVPHYHFTCLRCGKVIEFAAPEVIQVAQDLCRLKGLQIIQVHLHLTGYCSSCRSSADCEQK